MKTTLKISPWILLLLVIVLQSMAIHNLQRQVAGLQSIQELFCRHIIDTKPAK